MLIKQYDQMRWPFAKHVEYLMGQPLHEIRGEVGKSDQDTWMHKKVYQVLDHDFYEMYGDFIHHVIKGLCKDQVWSVQQIPTFRFQTPDHKGTKEFHRDRDYNHPSEALNIVVPLTKMINTTSIKMEKVPYTNEYWSPTLHVGEYMLFDGANTYHGTVNNEEGYTRVSFDFRLVPTKYVPIGGSTVTQKIPMREYYRKV